MALEALRASDDGRFASSERQMALRERGEVCGRGRTVAAERIFRATEPTLRLAGLISEPTVVPKSSGERHWVSGQCLAPNTGG